MRVAGIQFDITWEDPAANLTRVAPWIAAAAAAGARLCVLPELFACGFSMDTARLAEVEGGPTSEFLGAQARAHNMWICGSIPERGGSDPRPHNTLVLCSPQGVTHRYRKIHPFTFAHEHEHYAAGDSFVTVDVEGVRCTLFICYDLRFADEFWATAKQTDCYIVVANWPNRRRHHWTALTQARAIENQAFVVAVNRCGVGGELEYAGDSRIVDPWGELVATAAGQETMILAEVDAAVVADARARFPVLGDRR